MDIEALVLPETPRLIVLGMSAFMLAVLSEFLQLHICIDVKYSIINCINLDHCAFVSHATVIL